MPNEQVNRRIAFAATGIVIFLVGFLIAGGNQAVVRINFSVDVNYLEGTEVLIDGEVAGRLQRMGNRAETGFRVPPGEHTIELRHRDLPGEALTIEADPDAPALMLLADFQASVNADGTQNAHLALTY